MIMKSGRRGAVAVEMAIVAPIVLLFMFAAIDISRANMVRSTAENAVYEGARSSIIPGATPASIEADTREILNILSIKNATVTVTPSVITNSTAMVSVRVDIPLGDNCYASSKFLGSVNITRSCMFSRENFSVETVQ